MSSGSSHNNLAASRYVSALLDLAEEAKLVDKVEQDILGLELCIEESEDFRQLIQSPLLGKKQQEAGIFSIAEKAKMQQMTGNFLGVLIQNGRLSLLPAIIRQFKYEMRKRRGELEALVETAFALSPAQTDALQKELTKVMGSNVTLKVEVNEDLLGGLIVTVGSQMIDDSVARKLEKLQRTMSAGSNQNKAQLKEVG